jgi:hypothetical protein
VRALRTSSQALKQLGRSVNLEKVETLLDHLEVGNCRFRVQNPHLNPKP